LNASLEELHLAKTDLNAAAIEKISVWTEIVEKMEAIDMRGKWLGWKREWKERWVDDVLSIICRNRCHSIRRWLWRWLIFPTTKSKIRVSQHSEVCSHYFISLLFLSLSFLSFTHLFLFFLLSLIRLHFRHDSRFNLCECVTMWSRQEWIDCIVFVTQKERSYEFNFDIFWHL
jgi:hypothetical protein